MEESENVWEDDSKNTLKGLEYLNQKYKIEEEVNDIKLPIPTYIEALKELDKASTTYYEVEKQKFEEEYKDIISEKSLSKQIGNITYINRIIGDTISNSDKFAEKLQKDYSNGYISIQPESQETFCNFFLSSAIILSHPESTLQAFKQAEYITASYPAISKIASDINLIVPRYERYFNSLMKIRKELDDLAKNIRINNF